MDQALLKQKKAARRAPKRKKKIAILLIFNIIAISSLILILTFYGPLLYHEVKYSLATVFNEETKNSKKYYNNLPKNVVAARDVLLKPVVNIPSPKDPEFSVVIPKLGINQHVTPDVNINDTSAVGTALKKGIGWASGTVVPGDDGNSLLFAHSTRNSWDIIKYNAEFTLLGKMDINDMFTVVYKNRQMDFLIFEKKVVPAGDTSYLTSVADGRVVTLQTCYPPGNNTSRLLVRGRLIAMQVK